MSVQLCDRWMVRSPHAGHSVRAARSGVNPRGPAVVILGSSATWGRRLGNAAAGESAILSAPASRPDQAEADGRRKNGPFMASRASLVLLSLGGLAALALVWTLTRAPTPDVTPRVPPDPPVANQSMTSAPAPVRNPTRPQEMLGYPDGSFMPPLNGVTHPAPMRWPPDLRFSPVVGKRSTPDGTEWYIHADGTCSTTMMLWRSDLGRKDAITHVARPLPVAPVEDETTRK